MKERGKMKICTICKAENDDTSKYCKGCGEKFADERNVYERKAYDKNNFMNKKFGISSKFAPVPAAVVFMLSGIFGILYFISNTDHDFCAKAWFSNRCGTCDELITILHVSIIVLLLGIFSGFSTGRK